MHLNLVGGSLTIFDGVHFFPGDFTSSGEAGVCYVDGHSFSPVLSVMRRAVEGIVVVLVLMEVWHF